MSPPSDSRPLHPPDAYRRTGKSFNKQVAEQAASALGEGSALPCLLRLAQWGVTDLKSGNSVGTGLGAQVGGVGGVVVAWPRHVRTRL